MPNEYRDRGRDRFRGEDRSRGLFGYEGEGYMRGAEFERGSDRGDFGADTAYRGGYGDFNRGDYVQAGYDRPSFRGRGPKGYQRSDERILEEVCERLEFDDAVDASDIEVAVTSGTVKLSGTVDDRQAKRRAEDIAESVTGVKNVENQIRVP